MEDDAAKAEINLTVFRAPEDSSLHPFFLHCPFFCLILESLKAQSDTTFGNGKLW